jgi:hypothetical protein
MKSNVGVAGIIKGKDRLSGCIIAGTLAEDAIYIPMRITELQLVNTIRAIAQQRRRTMTLEDDLRNIESMTREEMCELWRYAPAGHPYFKRGTPQQKAFEERFTKLGRFSPQISKAIDGAPHATP